MAVDVNSERIEVGRFDKDHSDSSRNDQNGDLKKEDIFRAGRQLLGEGV